MQLVTFSLWYPSVSSLLCSSAAWKLYANRNSEHNTVFQSKLDILGMVIYATEFVLWCGVFACGGYYNLMPWVRGKMSERDQRKRDDGELPSVEVEGISNALELERFPSSTSVFRTPSSVANLARETRQWEWLLDAWIKPVYTKFNASIFVDLRCNF